MAVIPSPFGGGASVDTTPGDIQPAPTSQGAGVNAKASAADHTHGQPTLFAPTGLAGAVSASRYAGATASGAPGSGTFATGDYVVDQTGSFWICTTGGSPGTWIQVVAGSVVGGGNANQSNLLMPSGALQETFPRWLASSSISPSTGVVILTAIPLPKNTVVTNITMCTGTLGESGASNGWYALCDSTGKVLGVTAAQTGNTWASNATLITIALGSPVTISTAGAYYLAVSISASGVPGLMGFSFAATQASRQTPALSPTGGTQVAPPAVNSTLTLTAAAGNALWGYVS